MPLPKIEDARKLSDGELADEILAAKRELFNLRLQKATRRLEKPHQFRHVRHRIAQLMTVERERQIAAAAEAQQTVTASPAVETQPNVEEEE